MSIEVVVQVRSPEAVTLRAGRADTAAALEVTDAAAELGIALDPVDAEAAATPLANYFNAWVADPGYAQEVVERLLRCEAVESAYIKPPAEVP